MKIEDIMLEAAYRENKNSFKRLYEEIKGNKEDWMLCLGAGVSISAGLPNWYGLLARMSARLLVINSGEWTKPASNVAGEFGERRKKFYEAYGNNKLLLDSLERAFKGERAEPLYDINVLESAEYIEQFIEDRIEENNKELTDYYIKFLIKDSCNYNRSNLDKTALGAVARLMTKEKNESGLPIRNVITYNYDNLLEHYLRAACGCPASKIYSCVEGGEIKDLKSDQINIYHIHGRIPIIDEDKEAESERVILTESSYYGEEKMDYSWINILQSFALLRAKIIFIGFSGTDYNFRRVIKSVNGNKRHYLFFCVDDIVKNVFKKDIQEETAEKIVLQRKEGKENPDRAKVAQKLLDQKIREMKDGKYPFEQLYLDQLLYMQSCYWKKRNMQVIWTTIEELPSLLDKLE